MVVADTLSRAPLKECDSKIENEVNFHVDSINTHMPITDQRLKLIYDATQSDIQNVISFHKMDGQRKKNHCLN
jgi:hypothetical protein